MKDANFLKDNGVNLEKSLELLGDMETYNETLIDFLNAVFDKMTKIKLYKESKNMPDYAILVHSLKSDARYLGFDLLADIAYKHEIESKANNQLFVNENFNELVNEAAKIVTLVRQYLGQTPTPKQAEVKEESSKELNITNDALLVVDDSSIMQNFLDKIFSDRYQIIIASDGKEALDVLNAGHNDKIKCMLLDLNMPNINGFEVLEYLKANNLFDVIPVSIITGADSRETITKAFSYPIVDMLTKPFTELSVKTIVEKTVAQKK